MYPMSHKRPIALVVTRLYTERRIGPFCELLHWSPNVQLTSWKVCEYRKEFGQLPVSPGHKGRSG